ncbi:hypothetical protein Vafri_7656, partial [Volvox africanus]
RNASGEAERRRFRPALPGSIDGALASRALASVIGGDGGSAATPDVRAGAGAATGVAKWPPSRLYEKSCSVLPAANPGAEVMAKLASGDGRDDGTRKVMAGVLSGPAVSSKPAADSEDVCSCPDGRIVPPPPEKVGEWEAFLGLVCPNELDRNVERARCCAATGAAPCTVATTAPRLCAVW